ncbi:S41 family peptidase [Solitalea sp. MAHUQ-68]|uniref:Tricorn protease homolog n=1 Tax=Solitalea agri TaxID=2953739 RepID=A0A9X2F406_9SPHI|nr:S41 family peptidase [Solitalea agri]MCO4294347.1 S41 family peptidase [Solitalea agri]
MKKLIGAVAFLGLFHSAQAQENPFWMRYPAISPDGKTIVFSYKGDIYKMPSSGGQAIPLTLHEAQDFMPVWSHDGKSIAFASDRYGNFDVYVMPAEGGDAKRLTFHSANDLPADFTPDNKNVIFTSVRQDLFTSAQFPYGRMAETYSVPVGGGKTSMVNTNTMELARYSKDGKKIIYQDYKGYEDQWRKHHTSAVTKDIWMYDIGEKSYNKLTTFNGEDRNPVFGANGEVFYLSEESGSLNVYQMTATGGNGTKVTSFQKNPVRFLTAADDNTLCYTYDGEIYIQKPAGQPQKVAIKILTDGRNNTEKVLPVNSGVTEMALSPSGKEVAFVFRGEVFVSSVEGGVTKRVTNTPTQERSVSFSPDGRTLLYAAERDGTWDVLKSSIQRKEEAYFYSSTLLNEETLVASTDKDEFQPSFSPDGKEVAFLENRTTLRVLNIASKATRTLLTDDNNYSYSDGDQYYTWSPDGKWILASFSEPNQYFNSDIALIAADGKQKLTNLTPSGYSEGSPKWAIGGKMMIYFADRDGMKNHGSWGGESDVYGLFFTQEAFDRFKLSKTDFNLVKEQEDKEKKDKKTEEADSKDKKETKTASPEDKSIKIELPGIEDRRLRLTINSSDLSDAIMSPDGEKLYYLSKFEKGYDLWVTEPRSKDTKILAKLDGGPAGIEISNDGKSLFVVSSGRVSKVDAESGKVTPIGISSEMMLSAAQEREYIFNHAWRQVKEKFYVTNLQNVDWDYYGKTYKKFLPYINNNYDFAEMMSEMLGELNASHTGCRYSPASEGGDRTAVLGLVYDDSYNGNGLKVEEVLLKGPFNTAKSKVKAGAIIEKIDGQPITANEDYNKLLNRKAGKLTLISLFDPSNGTRWDESIKPLTIGEQNELLYNRWVENRRKEVDQLSGGKVGYVHVRGMNDESFRTVYEDVLGKNGQKESLIVDTRFNGGGWLHDDLVTLLSGKKYIDIYPREKHRGQEPFKKWTKPSVVLMGEGNYSDAHMFPYAYRANNVGKLIGMPVPGTGTAVWWETQIDPTLVFGIPQVGMLDTNGKYLENNQLEPDVKVANDPSVLTSGRDQQIETAVKELMKSNNLKASK